MTLLLASRNQNKLRELRAALPAWEIALLDAPDEPVEDGATFLDNARIKARHGRAARAGRRLGRRARTRASRSPRSEDVPESSPRAGPRTASRGCSRSSRDESDRRARYVCELVVLAPDGVELEATGTLEGEIAAAPRGDEGFGYDPIFVPRGESLTVAELGERWKAEHSHRARAARALAQLLAER